MKKILGLLFSASLLVSCHTDKTKRNYEYFPDMYYAVGYETYQAVPFLPNGTAAGLPADHTIARGHIPYELENTVDGKIASRTQPNRIADFDDKAAASGKALYDAYCATCHGTKALRAFCRYSLSIDKHRHKTTRTRFLDIING